MNIIILIIALVFVGISCSHIPPGMYTSSRFKDYRLLNEGPHEYENYEILKIVECQLELEGKDYSLGSYYLWHDDMTKDTLVVVQGEKHTAGSGGISSKCTVFIKIAENGAVIDSMPIQGFEHL